MQVIPGINCMDEEGVRLFLGQATSFLPKNHFVHLDIADGKFTYHKTWNDPQVWRKFEAPFSLEVHLMVEEPEREVPLWLAAGAKRVIVHYESIVGGPAREADPHPADGVRRNPMAPEDVIALILRECRSHGAEAFLAVNPETPVEPLRVYFEQFHGAQVLAVHPGLSGQKFLPIALEKIKFLRRALGDVTIEVDGGIVPETARRAKDAGATIAVSTSYIWQGSTDYAAAYKELASS